MQIKLKTPIIFFFTILICLFFTTISILAITNHFTKRKVEPIKLMNNIPTFTIDRIGGNNQNYELLPVPVPNLNQSKYNHLITINHRATLNNNGMDITTPLFLKITINPDAINTFPNPENYFVISTKVNGLDYDGTKLPQMIKQLDISISIQQTQLITSPNPQLQLICDYDLTDAQGNPFAGGSQSIKNVIKQTA